MKNVVIKNITDKADELAKQYNKTKDPGIRDQWYKAVTEVAKHISVDNTEYTRINDKRLPDHKKHY